MSGYLRRCSRCPNLSPRGLCDSCRSDYERERGNRHERGLDNEWAHASQAAVAAWVKAHGWVCPGDGLPGGQGEHPSRNLSGDHDVARAFGGSAKDGITVRCVSCNSRRGARMAPADHQAPLVEGGNVRAVPARELFV